MTAGDGNWQHETAATLVADDVRTTGTGTFQHTFGVRIDLREDIPATGSGSWQHEVVATLTTFAEPTPDGPERWDAPRYSFLGDGG
jgi:hypothetical protein